MPDNNARPRRIVPTLLAVAAGVCLIAAAVLVFPTLASAVYVEAGGRALDAAQTEGEAQNRAILHLEQAVEWDAGNAHAYRLLARARRLQHDWPGAVDAMARFVDLQPANRLGHIELAELYEEIRAQVEGGEATAGRFPAAAAAECAARAAPGSVSPEWDPVDLSCRAAGSWRQAGYTLADLIASGHEAEAAGHGDQALAWFRRAIDLEPGLGDGWYRLGQWYEKRQQWPLAIAAYEHALTIGRLALVPVSDVYYHTGLLYQSQLDPSALDGALRLYEAALAAGRFSTQAKAADCHYRRGEILQIQGREPGKVIAEFERAVALNPSHAWAHARLGSAYYQRDGDVAAAEVELQEALRLSPGSKWIYVTLGDIYRREGRTEDARTLYEQALELDPDFEQARERLQAINGAP